MKARFTKSNSTTRDLAMEKVVRAKFALLAKVGRQKREVSRLRDEVTFYSSSVTELAVASVDQLAVLQDLADRVDNPRLKAAVADVTSRHLIWMRKLLKHWPDDTECQQILFSLLESEGPQRLMGSTPEGYATLSTGLILGNVERVIAATREQRQRTSSR